MTEGNELIDALGEDFSHADVYAYAYDKGFKTGYEQRMDDELREKDTTNNEEHF